MPTTHFRPGVLAKLQTSATRRGRSYSSIMNHETDRALRKESRPDTWPIPSPATAVMTVSGRKYLLLSVAHPVNCTKTADVV